MILHVKGSNKAIRKLVESATRFYAEKLMGKRLTENLKITVNLKRNLLSKEALKVVLFGKTIAIVPENLLLRLILP